VVHFFRDIVWVAEVSKEALSQRTNDYQRWVEAYARAIIDPRSSGPRRVAQGGRRPALAKPDDARAYGVCGGSAPTRSRRSSAHGSIAAYPGSWPPSGLVAKVLVEKK
jgi:hypothetical protein